MKVLRYLWTDFEVPGVGHARNIARLPDGIADLLKEVSTRGKQSGGLHSAGGTLKAGVGSVRLRLLGIVFQSVGLPEKLSEARLVLHLKEDQALVAVNNAILAAGKDPKSEFSKIYTSKAFQEAYLAAYPHLKDTKNVGEALRAEFPAKVDEISIDDMLKVIRRALSTPKGLPATVIVLDEVQQFINGNADTANEVQEVVEACSKMLDGRVMFVGTGQSALTDTPALQRLMGRFTTKVHLRDNDVEKVVRTVVLNKTETHKQDISSLASKQSGEITRQLRETKLATRADDDKAYVPDYPLLPVRRRFWELVLHSVDPSGAAAQMRTQLRVTHEACRAVGDRPIGAVVPADFLYDQLANDLVISGEMQKRFQEIIEEQQTKQDGALRRRICALTFLIGKLPRDGQDQGVRANAEHLADLLTDDLGKSATLRQRIPVVLKDLAEDGVLMEVEGEYRLQTTEGATWEHEFRRRRTALLNNEPQIGAARAQLLSAEIQSQIGSVAVLHGSAKEKRKVTVHHSSEPPSSSIEGLVVWVRDGFQGSENAVIQDIQKRSVDDATIHVLVPRAKSDELKNALASSLAADETLNFKGTPTGDEGKEARSAMLSRQAIEANKVSELVTSIVDGARVFLSGGQERPTVTLNAAVKDAANDVLSRLYPTFHVADNPNWPAVWKRAKDGSPASLQAVGYNGDPDKHPVSAEVLKFVGAGKKGTEVVAHFGGGPYGWPKDAVDAVLATLVVSGHLNAQLPPGQAIQVSDLDQRKAGQANYRLQHPVLTATQKLRVRKLFQHAGHPYQVNDEAGAAPGFVQLMKAKMAKAGGDPPAPSAPQSPTLTELQGLTGNDLLFGLHTHADYLTERVNAWDELASEVEERLAQFRLAERLAAYASGLPEAAPSAETLAQIRANRSLLDDPNPTEPVKHTLESALRGGLHQAHNHYETTLAAERTKLAANPVWITLAGETQDELLSAAGIATRTLPALGDASTILAALQQCDLIGWRTHADALATKCAQALAAAVKAAEPKARQLTLPNATLRNEVEMNAWLERVRVQVQAALQDGPVVL